MSDCEPGAMLAVSASAVEIDPFVGQGTCISVVNSVTDCVVSGSGSDISELEVRLDAAQIRTTRLSTSHAFHSPLMRPAVKPFEDKVANYELGRPQTPFLSNVSGDWITDEEAMSPSYWAGHICAPVQLLGGLNRLAATKPSAFLVVGPGAGFARFIRASDCYDGQRVLLATNSAIEEQSPADFIRRLVGQIWRWMNRLGHTLSGQPLRLEAGVFHYQPIRLSENVSG